MLQPRASATIINCVHDEASRRFVGKLSGLDAGPAAFLEYRFVTPTHVDFFRTVTEPALRGKGAAGQVVEAAFAWAQSKKLAVTPSCSYVQAFVEKHPQFAHLVSKL